MTVGAPAMATGPAARAMASYPEFAALSDWYIRDGALVLAEPLRFGADPDHTGWALALLRECQSFGVTVHWHAVRSGPFDFGALRHLFPPQSLDGADQDNELTTWRASYRYGQYYFRIGPGFIQVKDVRVRSAASRFALAEPALRDMFLRCLHPTRLAGLPASQRAAVDELAAEELLLCHGGTAVTVVPRLRRRPVPAGAV